jgi:thiol-disulfide isomerase/thioredoxin
LALLDKFREHFSDDFFLLRRADILGRMSQYKLDYLVSNGDIDLVFNQFELKSVNPKRQNQSFEYGYFVESLVEAYRENLKNTTGDGLSKDYSTIKNVFTEDLIGKPIAERLIANKMNASLDLDGYSTKVETIFRDFKEFAKNDNYVTYLERKLGILKGKSLGEPAPSFVLTDSDGDFVSLKDFKGKNLLIVFWASWCTPCLQDLAYLPIISNYFREDKNLSILNIAVDTPDDFNLVRANAVSSSEFSARVDPNSKFLKEYGVISIPSYILLDKEGNWLKDDLIEPALDEGRGLIKQLENIIRK